MKRAVVRVREVVGLRGGKVLVLVMECGHWKTARAPRAEAQCVACLIERQLHDEGEGRP